MSPLVGIVRGLVTLGMIAWVVADVPGSRAILGVILVLMYAAIELHTQAGEKLTARLTWLAERVMPLLERENAAQLRTTAEALFPASATGLEAHLCGTVVTAHRVAGGAMWLEYHDGRRIRLSPTAAGLAVHVSPPPPSWMPPGQ